MYTITIFLKSKGGAATARVVYKFRLNNTQININIAVDLNLYGTTNGSSVGNELTTDDRHLWHIKDDYAATDTANITLKPTIRQTDG